MSLLLLTVSCGGYLISIAYCDFFHLICFGLEEKQKDSAEERRSDDESKINFLLTEILQVDEGVTKTLTSTAELLTVYLTNC